MLQGHRVFKSSTRVLVGYTKSGDYTVVFFPFVHVSIICQIKDDSIVDEEDELI